MNRIEESILKLDGALQQLPFDFAFLGGSVLSLLVTDANADAIRVTKDIDVMTDIRSRTDFHNAERLLEGIGFTHDTREDAPICRWVYEGITVDVLPIREEVLGWESKWFPEALASAATVLRDGRSVKVVSAPFFVILKLEAFEERGKRDFVGSTDFEDVICLFNGRETIVDEIAADKAVSAFIAAKMKAYLASPELEYAVEGFVQTEDNPEKRMSAILERFRLVAKLE